MVGQNDYDYGSTMGYVAWLASSHQPNVSYTYSYLWFISPSRILHFCTAKKHDGNLFWKYVTCSERKNQHCLSITSKHNQQAYMRVTSCNTHKHWRAAGKTLIRAVGLAVAKYPLLTVHWSIFLVFHSLSLSHCMCKRMYTYIYIHIHIFLYICGTYVLMSVFLYICLHPSPSPPLPTTISTGIHKHTYCKYLHVTILHKYKYIYTHTSLSIHIYTCIYTRMLLTHMYIYI